MGFLEKTLSVEITQFFDKFLCIQKITEEMLSSRIFLVFLENFRLFLGCKNRHKLMSIPGSALIQFSQFHFSDHICTW